MSEQKKRFDYKRWFVDVSKWFTQITMCIFVAKTGMQNGSFDDLIIKLIASSGFTVYLSSVGLHLLSEDYWTCTEIENENDR